MFQNYEKNLEQWNNSYLHTRYQGNIDSATLQAMNIEISKKTYFDQLEKKATNSQGLQRQIYQADYDKKLNEYLVDKGLTQSNCFPYDPYRGRNLYNQRLGKNGYFDVAQENAFKGYDSATSTVNIAAVDGFLQDLYDAKIQKLNISSLEDWWSTASLKQKETVWNSILPGSWYNSNQWNSWVSYEEYISLYVLKYNLEKYFQIPVFRETILGFACPENIQSVLKRAQDQFVQNHMNDTQMFGTLMDSETCSKAKEYLESIFQEALINRKNIQNQFIKSLLQVLDLYANKQNSIFNQTRANVDMKSQLRDQQLAKGRAKVEALKQAFYADSKFQYGPIMTDSSKIYIPGAQQNYCLQESSRDWIQKANQSALNQILSIADQQFQQTKDSLAYMFPDYAQIENERTAIENSKPVFAIKKKQPQYAYRPTESWQINYDSFEV